MRLIGAASACPIRSPSSFREPIMSSSRFEKIDSHIHLYAAGHIPSLAWAGGLPAEHPLNRQNSVAEYRVATSTPSKLKGFVFLETDRKSSLDPKDWGDALDEVSFLNRIVTDSPIPEEGHACGDAALVKGIVPWAPMPAGPEALDTYMAQLQERCRLDTWKRVKGVRYLLQDKHLDVMRSESFVDGMRWLGKKSLTFDLGVDARSGGMVQLREAVKMLERVFDRSEQGPNVIINHMCKPNMRLSPQSTSVHLDFEEWKTCIKQMSGFTRAYMKLSGGFSELPPQEPGNPTPPEQLLKQISPWTKVVFETFGPRRVMYGSDWPVCNVGGAGSQFAWKNWVRLVELILEEHGLTEDEMAMVWAGTASLAYGIDSG